MKRDNWYDSSGIRLFYTPKLRPNDIGTMRTGQIFMDIPASTSEVMLFVQERTWHVICDDRCQRNWVVKNLKIMCIPKRVPIFIQK